MDTILAILFEAIGTKFQYFVDIGKKGRSRARTNVAFFHLRCDWKGLWLDENAMTLLESQSVPRSLDLISIDTDGDDLQLLEKSLLLLDYRPRVIVIAISSYFHIWEAMTQRPLPDRIWAGKPQVKGSSMRAVDRLLKPLGYVYVAQAADEYAVFVLGSEIEASNRGGTPMMLEPTMSWQLQERGKEESRYWVQDDFVEYKWKGHGMLLLKDFERVLGANLREDLTATAIKDQWRSLNPDINGTVPWSRIAAYLEKKNYQAQNQPPRLAPKHKTVVEIEKKDDDDLKKRILRCAGHRTWTKAKTWRQELNIAVSPALPAPSPFYNERSLLSQDSKSSLAIASSVTVLSYMCWGLPRQPGCQALSSTNRRLLESKAKRIPAYVRRSIQNKKAYARRQGYRYVMASENRCAIYHPGNGRSRGISESVALVACAILAFCAALAILSSATFCAW